MLRCVRFGDRLVDPRRGGRFGCPEAAGEAPLVRGVGGVQHGLIIGTALLLEQQGRRLAHVPFLATLALGALPLAQFGSDDQKNHWLAAVAAGAAVLTAALGSVKDGAGPSIVAARAAEAWRLDGTELLVPNVQYADCGLLPARHADGSSTVFLLDPALGIPADYGAGVGPHRSAGESPLRNSVDAG